jgi:hypothetical protein
VIFVEVRDRYSPDEEGDCDIGVKRMVLDEGELGVTVLKMTKEEDMGVDESEVVD